MVLDEIKESSSTPISLLAVKLLATYLSPQHDSEVALMSLSEWLSDPRTGQDPTLLVVAALIYSHEEKYKEALEAIRKGDTLEL